MCKISRHAHLARKLCKLWAQLPDNENYSHHQYLGLRMGLPRCVKFPGMRASRASCPDYGRNYPTMKIIRIINILPISPSSLVLSQLCKNFDAGRRPGAALRWGLRARPSPEPLPFAADVQDGKIAGAKRCPFDRETALLACVNQCAISNFTIGRRRTSLWSISERKIAFKKS
jgi:hypothetical protein